MLPPACVGYGASVGTAHCLFALGALAESAAHSLRVAERHVDAREASPAVASRRCACVFDSTSTQPCCQRVQPPGPPPHAHHPDSVVRPLPPLDAVVASAHRVGHVISDMKAFPLRTQPGWRLARRPGSARLCRVRRSSARSVQRGDRLHVCRWWRKQDGAPCARGRASRWQLGLRTPSSETILHRNAPLVLCLSMVSLCLGLFATSSLGWDPGVSHM